jgi:serine/threonine protein kinase
MISGRSPWRYATCEDETFATFLCSDNLLRRILPISEGANDILKKIFTIEPRDRISLKELRADILRLDTFFSTEEHFQPVDAPTHHEANGGAKVDGGQSRADNSSLSSDEYYKFRSPQVDEAPAGAVLVFADNINTAGPRNCLTPAKETDSGSSGQDSQGPITPATKAVDPQVHIPDIEDEIKGLSLNTNVSGTSDILSKLKKPFAKHMFRLALGRFGGMSCKEAPF